MFNSNYNLLSYNWPRIILINSHTNQKSLGDLFKVFLANQHLSECVCVWMCVSGGMCQCVCVRVLWCSVSVCVKMGVYVEGLCMNVCIVCVWMCGVWVCALIGVTGCAWVWGRCVCVYVCMRVFLCVCLASPPHLLSHHQVWVLQAAAWLPWDALTAALEHLPIPCSLPPPLPQSIPRWGTPKLPNWVLGTRVLSGPDEIAFLFSSQGFSALTQEDFLIPGLGQLLGSPWPTHFSTCSDVLHFIPRQKLDLNRPGWGAQGPLCYELGRPTSSAVTFNYFV